MPDPKPPPPMLRQYDDVHDAYGERIRRKLQEHHGSFFALGFRLGLAPTRLRDWDRRGVPSSARLLLHLMVELGWTVEDLLETPADD